jgi:hypothetical protein
VTILLEAGLSDVGQWVELPAPGRVTPVRALVRDIPEDVGDGFQTANGWGSQISLSFAGTMLQTAAFMVQRRVQVNRLGAFKITGQVASQLAFAIHRPVGTTAFFVGATVQFPSLGLVPGFVTAPLIAPAVLDPYVVYYAGIWSNIGATPIVNFRAGPVAVVGAGGSIQLPVTYAQLLADLALAGATPNTVSPWMVGGL